jgi:RNA polymerase sigma-70 factor (ECF subfamily)
MLAKSDRAAFAELYRRYVTPVYRYAYRSLGDAAQAEDATSLTFLKALQAIRTCDEQSFRAWLFTIAHNAIVDAHRSARRSLPLAAAGSERDTGDSPEGAALAEEQTERLRSLLTLLPADQRELIELRLSGLNDLEIARVVGRTHGAVRTSQYRAIQRLRAACAEFAGEEGS